MSNDLSLRATAGPAAAARTCSYIVLAASYDILLGYTGTVAGVLVALLTRYNGPEATLSFGVMVDILLMVVIGGMGTLYGPALGAAMSARAVIIDTDPGTDDAVALFLALGSPELDVRLVSVVGGNVGLARTLANARAIVGLSGRRVPVVAGAERPLLGGFTSAPHAHGDDGLFGVALPEGPPAAPGVAADAIRAVLRGAAPASVTLIGIGPATNLALALATEPELAGRVAEIVLMTGAVGEGNVTPAAEFNAWSDPEALAVLLACGRPVVLATLETTAQALCTPARKAALRARGGGACARAVCDIWDRVPVSARLGGLGHPEHDACAVAWAVAPHLFGVRKVCASVELAGASRGRTNIFRHRLPGAANARLLETLDAEGFFALLGERVAGLGNGMG